MEQVKEILGSEILKRKRRGVIRDITRRRKYEFINFHGKINRKVFKKIKKEAESLIDKMIAEEELHEKRLEEGKKVDSDKLGMGHYEFLADLLPVYNMLRSVKKLNWIQRLLLPKKIQKVYRHFEEERYWVKELSDFGYYHKNRIYTSGNYRP